MTDTTDEMSVEKSTTSNVSVVNISDYHQTDLFLRNEQVKHPDIPLRDVILSHVTSLRALFRLYGFGYSRSTLSESSHHKVSMADVTTPSTCGMTVGRQVLNNDITVLFLDGRDFLEGM